MKVFIDIETIPDQSPNALDEYLGQPVKCPFTTKGDIGKDLGMSADEIKFTGLPDLKQRWVDEKGAEAAKEQAKEKWLKTSFDGGKGSIVCIGFAVNNMEINTVTNKDATEKEMLEQFWSMVVFGNEGRTPQLIAHNASFDLPFLWHRSVINGVAPSIYFSPYARQGEKRYCTMEAWAGFNGKISLDNLAKTLGVQGKSEGMTGADVWPEYQKGNIDKIAKYCADDVRVLREVYNRMNFITK